MLTFGGAPVPVELSRRIETSICRGQGPTRAHAGPSVACYARALGGRHGAVDAHQPYITSRGVLVALDGRLDERDALASELQAPRDALTDIALVAAAYERWGTSCFARLFGEWSIAIYDPGRRQLTLATDFSGSVPLYYSVTAHHAVWSSELATFVHAGHGSRIDPRYLLGFILGFPELGHTPYEGVAAVPPGHAVSIAGGQVRTIPVWTPDLTERLVYRTDREYEEHFRDVFWRVIGDRVSRPWPVWAELSGGLDSSSIVCVGQRIVAASGGGGDRLCAVSYRFHGGDSDDDAQAQQQVVRSTGCRSVIVDARDLPYLADDAPVVALPGGIGGVVPVVARLMAESGSRVLMSGEGGDGLMCDGRGWPSPLLTESLRAGRPLQMLQEAFASGRSSARSVWDLLWKDVVRARRWKQPDFFAPSPPAWIPARTVAEYREWALGYRRYPSFSGCTAAAALGYHYVDVARRCVAAQPDRLTGSIDLSYPYLDRRLVQFMLAVPFHQKLRPGMGRLLQRRSLEGVLPDVVRLRRGKSSGRGPLIRALDAEWARVDRLLSPRGRLAELNLVDLEAVRLAAASARRGRAAEVGRIWKILALEHWLQSSEARMAA